MQVADALRDALRRVRELEAQLKVAESFHAVAVAQRDAAWCELGNLKALLRSQETALNRVLMGHHA